jgi:hypothetical protein
MSTTPTPEGLSLVPVTPTEAMLRPFYECPPDELPLAWAAMLTVARAALAGQAKSAAPVEPARLNLGDTFEPTMNIYAQPGTKVRFRAGGGHEWQKEAAIKAGFVKNMVYTVKRCDVDHSSTRVLFDEIPGRWNSCLFADVTAPPAAIPEAPAQTCPNCDMPNGCLPCCEDCPQHDREASVKRADATHWDGKYREKCPDSMRCLGGCHSNEPCHAEAPAQTEAIIEQCAAACDELARGFIVQGMAHGAEQCAKKLRGQIMVNRGLRATPAQQDTNPQPSEEVMDLCLCEFGKVVPQPRRFYRPLYMPGCKSCERLAADQLEAYGARSPTYDEWHAIDAARLPGDDDTKEKAS